jgi:hypothetical protein
MRVVSAVVLVLFALVMLAGCAPGANGMRGTMDAKGVIAGFWRGLWNGIIAPVTFIISLFNPAVQIYEVHNNGGWYNAGFLLGMIMIFGGGAGGTQARRRRR